jgi:hypothetical protein
MQIQDRLVIFLFISETAWTKSEGAWTWFDVYYKQWQKSFYGGWIQFISYTTKICWQSVIDTKNTKE